MAYASEFRYKRSGHKKNKLSSRRKAFLIGAAVFAVIIVVTVCLQRNVSGILYDLSEASVRAMAVRSVNEAVSETLSGAGYDSFVTIGYDESGNVREITANSQKVNLFARTTATAAMAKLGAASAEGIKVPLGAFTGISFLAGFGPKVTFKIISVSSVDCSFSSVLSDAGVNQTLHSVYLNVSAAVSVVMPSGAREIETQTDVQVAETVIVGEVPDVYFGADIFGDGYHLAP